MSASFVTTVFARYPGRGASLTVFLALAETANDLGNCYVTLAELAAAARVSRATVGLAVRKLRAGGWVVTSRVFGQGRCLAYQINLAKLKRSVRPQHDPDRIATDAIRAARRAAERRAQKYPATSVTKKSPARACSHAA